jgi:hypothetical protein
MEGSRCAIPQFISALSRALLKFIVNVFDFTCAPRSAIEVARKKWIRYGLTA